MLFARSTFRLAGIWGLLLLIPPCFLEQRIGLDAPPPITHPEFFYGFCGVALAWQVAFLIIGQDPARYRPLMLAAILEKASFGGAAIVLFAQGRLAGLVLAFGLIDLAWGALFAIAWWVTSPRSSAGFASSDAVG